MSTNDTGAAAAAASTAKDEASSLAHSAADSGQNLYQDVKSGAADVTAEATDQVRDLFGEARAGLTDQASEQQVRAAASLRALGDEFGRMAEGSQEGGLATDLVRQAAERTGSVAAWLEDREPGDVLQEVTDFARRRPGVFLALAAGAGVLAGRVTRGLKDAPPADRATTPAPPRRTSTRPTGPAAAAPTAQFPSAQSSPGGGPTEAGLTGAAARPEQEAWHAAGGPAPVAPGYVPAADQQGTAGGDPLAGLVREDRP